MEKLLILKVVFLFASYIHNSTGQWQRPPRWTKDQSCIVSWRTEIEERMNEKFIIQVKLSHSEQKGMIRWDLPQQDSYLIWSLYGQWLTYTFPWDAKGGYGKSRVEKPFKMTTKERGIALSIMYPDLSNFTLVGGSHPFYKWRYVGRSENGQVMSEVLLKQDQGQNPEIVRVVSEEYGKRSVTYDINYQYVEPPEAIWSDTNFVLRNISGTRGGHEMEEELVKNYLMGEGSIWNFNVHPRLGMYQVINDRPSLRLDFAHEKPFPYLREFENFPYPWALDWTLCNAVSNVKDQFQCAACATFVAVSVLESAHYIHTLSREQLNLAVQAALDCSWSEGNHGCFNGYPPNVFEWVINNEGIPRTEIYGYGQFRRMNGRCMMSDPRSLAAKITSWTRIPSKIRALKMALLRHGPVATGATYDELVSYNYRNVDYGIIQTPANMSAPLTHALLVVGWNVSPSGVPYWKVRNSWGSQWGLQGYTRVLMSEERNTLRLLDEMFYVNLEFNGSSPTYCEMCGPC